MRMGHLDHLLSGLEAYGLSKKEAEIYLALLQKGPSTILEIAKKTHQPRTTLYPMLDKLVNAGIIKSGKDKKKTVFTIEHPRSLKRKLEERNKTLDEISPELTVLYENITSSPDVVFYEGTEGFKRLWQRIYNSGVKEYRILTNEKGMLEYVKEPYLVESIIARRIELGIKSYQIIVEGDKTKIIIDSDKEQLRESRLLPKDALIPATLIQFGTEVAFMTTRRENAMIIMTSGDVAITFKTMFDLLWKCSKNPYENV